MTQYEIKQIHGKFDKNESKFGQPGNGMAVPPGVQSATQSVDTVNGPSANGPHPVGPNKPKFHIVK